MHEPRTWNDSNKTKPHQEGPRHSWNMVIPQASAKLLLFKHDESN